MPLYDTQCDTCGREEQDYLAHSDEVVAYGKHEFGFPCQACGGRAIVQPTTARSTKLPNDNRLAADITGDRLTPREFTAKYGADSIPMEPWSPMANRKRDALKAYNHRRAQAGGFRDVPHMMREVRRQQGGGR